MTFVRGYSDARQPSTTLLPRSNHLLSTASFSAVQHRWSVSAHTRIRRSRSPPYTSPPRVLEVLSFLRTESIRGLCDRPQIPNSVSCEPPFSLFLAISSQQRPNRRVRPPVLTAADLEKGYRRCSRTTSQLLVDRTSNHRLLVARTDFGNAPLPDSEPGASSPQHPGGARADRSTTGAIYITATAAATGKTNTVCFTQSNLLPLLTICCNSLSPP